VKAMMRTLVVVLTMTLASVARAQLPCPISDGANPSIGTLSTWTGHVGKRPITCTLCSSLLFVVTDQPAAWVLGGCRVPRFGRRHLFTLAAGTLGLQAEGLFCPRPPPLLPDSTRGCCTLSAEAPDFLFDATHPPTSVRGTFQCPHKSGTFTLSSETTP